MDSVQGDSELSALKNLFNEWMVRDTSKKIKAVFKSKGMNGKPLTSHPPYGYIKGEDGTFAIDEETAPVVKQIYAFCLAGNGPGKIARMLTEQNIPTPGTIEYQRTGNTRRYYPDYPCKWSATTVGHILERQEYIGNTVNFKTEQVSYKVKGTLYTPEREMVFENTHPAIIDIDTFDKVQEIREQRHRRTKSGNSHMFSGLVFCADCKSRMSFSSAKGDESKWYFTCSKSRGKDSPCTAHYLRAIVLERLVWHYTQRVIELVLRYEAHFRAIIEQKLQTESAAILKAKRKQLEKAEKRIKELDRLFVRTYEDNVAGKLSDERFESMSRGYEEEQQGLKAEAESLRREIEVQEQQNQNLELFIERVQKYADLDELTPYAAHELIKAIYVGAPDKSSGKRRQSIYIQYDLIGFIPLDELMKQETA